MTNVVNWQGQEKDLLTLEETISEMEESCQADITIDSVEMDIANDIMIVEATAESRTKEDKAQDITLVEGLGFAGASCTPPATCSGTMAEACDHVNVGLCRADPCCRWHPLPDAYCYEKLCSGLSDLDACNTCAGCSAACWSITDDCALTADTNVGGIFINTGGSLVHTNNTLMANCFKKVAADASYYKKNTTAKIRITGASCPC